MDEVIVANTLNNPLKVHIFAHNCIIVVLMCSKVLKGLYVKRMNAGRKCQHLEKGWSKMERIWYNLVNTQETSPCCEESMS